MRLAGVYMSNLCEMSRFGLDEMGRYLCATSVAPSWAMHMTAAPKLSGKYSSASAGQ
jgi:hypothetical protein